MPNPVRALLWGWGRTNPTIADEVTVAAVSLGGDAEGGRAAWSAWPGVSGAAMATPPRTAAAWCCGSQRAASDIVLDPANGRVTVGAGVSIDELLRVIVPRGFFVPVTPGTRFVTIGGAIASDIHGKNHHIDGSIGNHIESITHDAGRRLDNGDRSRHATRRCSGRRSVEWD